MPNSRDQPDPKLPKPHPAEAADLTQAIMDEVATDRRKVADVQDRTVQDRAARARRPTRRLLILGGVLGALIVANLLGFGPYHIDVPAETAATRETALRDALTLATANLDAHREDQGKLPARLEEVYDTEDYETWTYQPGADQSYEISVSDGEHRFEYTSPRPDGGA